MYDTNDINARNGQTFNYEPELPRLVVGLTNIKDMLQGSDLDIDNEGFIVEMNTGEYATPYAFDRDTFKEVESPVDDPFEAYFQPEADANCLHSSERLHLSDLHTATPIDGKIRPVRDDAFMLMKMFRNVGMVFSVVTAWSGARDLVDEDEFDAPCVVLNHPGMADEELSLSCLRCDFDGKLSTWEVGEDNDPTCPECGGDWLSGRLSTCSECGETHWFEELNHSHYSPPTCPECGSDDLDDTTYYDR